MLRRRLLATAAVSFAAPAIVSRRSLGQNLRKVKMGSAFTTTTNAAFLMPKMLKEEGIDLELVMFPSLVQRMQAVASGDYATTSEVVRDALRHWKRARENREAILADLRAAWFEGLASGDPQPLDPEEIKASGRRRLAAERSGLKA